MLNPLSAAPRLYTSPGPSSLGAAILERCEALRQPFTPTPWAVTGHAQSALGGEGGRREEWWGWAGMGGQGTVSRLGVGLPALAQQCRKVQPPPSSPTCRDKISGSTH
jgi:hypothetical protein